MITFKRVFLFFVFLLLSGAALAYGARWYFMTFEPHRSTYPEIGIDVSHHQGKIDWDVVAKNDVSFVYMKSTEGGDWKDLRFQENWREARRVGLEVGAYHFFTFCRPGKDQAVNFIDSVPAEPDALPPAVDLEFGGNCKDAPSKQEIVREIEVFLEQLKSHYNMTPVIYVTPEFYDAYKDERFLKTHPIWARSILFEPDYAYNDWTIWQFHNRGARKGINGPVDLNVRRRLR